MSSDLGYGSGLRRWLPLALVAGLTLALFTGGAGTASAKWTQPTCGKFQKQIRKAQKRVRQAKGAAKKAARLQLRAAKQKQKQCANDRMVFAQVKNSRLVGGKMGDGSPIDNVYCANGTWKSGSAAAMKTGWKITASIVRNSRNYVAAINGNRTGGSYSQIGIVRKGNNWEVGWMSFDVLKDSGPVVKTDAKAICATL